MYILEQFPWHMCISLFRIYMYVKWLQYRQYQLYKRILYYFSKWLYFLTFANLLGMKCRFIRNLRLRMFYVYWLVRFLLLYHASSSPFSLCLSFSFPQWFKISIFYIQVFVFNYHLFVIWIFILFIVIFLNRSFYFNLVNLFFAY